ncbi:hypothetical protein GWK47_012214 [Chionoecetes opilio]|uniref:Uncharacterized protein n=1 Tax=Chionoecetes opilio TaxID=41210 RepID=A0A8J5CM77_CHIOP|nr:hypothetical protein GWK47_012214 [Chionoecetes opilio]
MVPMLYPHILLVALTLGKHQPYMYVFMGGLLEVPSSCCFDSNHWTGGVKGRSTIHFTRGLGGFCLGWESELLLGAGKWSQLTACRFRRPSPVHISIKQNVTMRRWKPNDLALGCMALANFYTAHQRSRTENPKNEGECQDLGWTKSPKNVFNNLLKEIFLEDSRGFKRFSPDGPTKTTFVKLLNWCHLSSEPSHQVKASCGHQLNACQFHSATWQQLHSTVARKLAGDFTAGTSQPPPRRDTRDQIKRKYPPGHSHTLSQRPGHLRLSQQSWDTAFTLPTVLDTHTLSPSQSLTHSYFSPRTVLDTHPLSQQPPDTPSLSHIPGHSLQLSPQPPYTRIHSPKPQNLIHSLRTAPDSRIPLPKSLRGLIKSKGSAHRGDNGVFRKLEDLIPLWCPDIVRLGRHTNKRFAPSIRWASMLGHFFATGRPVDAQPHRKNRPPRDDGAPLSPAPWKGRALLTMVLLLPELAFSFTLLLSKHYQQLQDMTGLHNDSLSGILELAQVYASRPGFGRQRGDNVDVIRRHLRFSLRSNRVELSANAIIPSDQAELGYVYYNLYNAVSAMPETLSRTHEGSVDVVLHFKTSVSAIVWSSTSATICALFGIFLFGCRNCLLNTEVDPLPQTFGPALTNQQNGGQEFRAPTWEYYWTLEHYVKRRGISGKRHPKRFVVTSRRTERREPYLEAFCHGYLPDPDKRLHY